MLPPREEHWWADCGPRCRWPEAPNQRSIGGLIADPVAGDPRHPNRVVEFIPKTKKCGWVGRCHWPNFSGVWAATAAMSWGKSPDNNPKVIVLSHSLIVSITWDANIYIYIYIYIWVGKVHLDKTRLSYFNNLHFFLLPFAEVCSESCSMEQAAKAIESTKEGEDARKEEWEETFFFPHLEMAHAYVMRSAVKCRR